jgi:N-acetylneuraminate synthase
MVRAIRDVELALGDGVKQPSRSEWKNRDVARKSLVAARAIAAGETFSAENVTCKRPGTALSPFELWHIIGETADRAYDQDEALDG